METKRLTLDNSGLTFRGRNYLDEYVPVSSQPRRPQVSKDAKQLTIVKKMDEPRPTLMPIAKVSTQLGGKIQPHAFASLAHQNNLHSVTTKAAKASVPIATEVKTQPERPGLVKDTEHIGNKSEAARTAQNNETMVSAVVRLAMAPDTKAPAIGDSGMVAVVSKKQELMRHKRKVELPNEPEQVQDVEKNQDITSLLGSIQGNLGKRMSDFDGDDSEMIQPFRWRLRSVLVPALAILLLIGGFMSLFMSLRSNHAVVQQVKALSDTANSSSAAATNDTPITDSLEVPNEEKLADQVVASYTVASNVPRYISSEKLVGGAKSRILRMGLTDDGAVAVPRSVWDAGWYEGSNSPSDKNGSTLIVGHVAGPTSGGIFYNLYRLEVGDEIQITLGDDSVKTYQVVAKEEVPAGGINMNTYMVSKNIDKPGLTLMTCAGEFDSRTNSYENRLAVFAVLKN